ncbi:MAG: NUDIX domain-containing protein [Gammaproteobacteria bacterium]|nr:NUDIX domain-containing protein [Gammaproteobacteria bacterium]
MLLMLPAAAATMQRMAKSFHVGVKALIVRKERILLLRSQSFWDLPGGRIEGAESPLETLERELNEELPGIRDIEIGALLGWQRARQYRHKDHALLLVAFRVDAHVPDPIRLSVEHDHAEWVQIACAREILEHVAIDWSRID